MCGRYHRKFGKQKIAEHFRIGGMDELYMELESSPSYNVAPQTFQPIVRLDRDGQRELVLAKWGLVPFWSKTAKLAYNTINARADKILESSVYREPFKQRRALVPASGFFEWQKLDAKKKQAYAFAVKDAECVAFAAVWDRWKEKDTDRVLESFSLITAEPNEISVDVHDRMPVIVDPADYDRWLTPGDPHRPPVDLLRSFPAERMTLWPVSADVGNVRNNRPELIERIPAGN